jgi:8-oxo-dGTP diphosphatase
LSKVNRVKQKNAFFCDFSIFTPMKRIEVVAGIICDGAPHSAETRFFATQRGYGDQKDGWEFPGGKVEPGETAQQALARELREELAIDVNVGEFLCTVDYDYPAFHLTMHCFYCTIAGNKAPELLEHEAARWLTRAELHSVNWLPADIEVLKTLEKKRF